MSVIRWLKQLYSLDTLDARFSSSQQRLRQHNHKVGGTIEEPLRSLSSRQNPARDTASNASQPRWNTWEFYGYGVVFITIVPLMFWAPYKLSQNTDSQFSNFSPLLSDGWLFGRQVDNSDSQYASFRANIPNMAGLLLLHPLLRHAYNYLRPQSNPEYVKEAHKAAIRLQQRTQFDIIFALGFLFVLHGSSALKILFILWLNYTLATHIPRRLVPAFTWGFNILILFANEMCHGYSYTTMIETAQFLVKGQQYTPTQNWGLWLDSYGGLIPRWEIGFNISVLRLISFNLDYYWSLGREAGNIVTGHVEPPNASERYRLTTPGPPTTFTFSNYLAYVLYSPLYLAGPIITFNDYISQSRQSLPSIKACRTSLYGLRFLIDLLTMEVILHFIYAVAIFKSHPNWDRYSPFQLSMLGYFNLHIIWLKLLLPWRFFRLWSLIDAVDPPENMIRCMSNNYSALAFWRGWHRSFNRWIIRYIYIPLGGANHKGFQWRGLFNIAMVFTFVALWHDISLRLFAWSWLIILFLLPEILCTTIFFPAKAYRDRPNLYRILSGIGAVGNVLMMMAANLVGFAIGTDGLQGLMRGIISTWEGIVFICVACGTLFVGIMVMFEVREEEKRHGVDIGF